MLNSTENSPASANSIGSIGLILAASGATLLSFTMAATTVAAVIWAAVKLMGLPDMALYVLLAAGVIPTIWVTVWTAGRAWHVERRLAQGLDVDTPAFKMLHYFSKR